MSNQEILETAIGIAVESHTYQYREDGSPYILHPMRVMMQMETLDEKVTAILHDVIEDSGKGFTELFFLLNIDQSSDIARAMVCLTKKKNEFYGEYIDRIKPNQMATKVKLADLRDNLNVLELKDFSDYKVDRVRKYLESYRNLSL
jgi:hypothetical protein